MDHLDVALTAIADPIRRSILQRLAHGPATAGQLATLHSVSRPAVSRHLRVLREAGVVSATAVDRRRVYRLEHEAIDEAGAWVEGVRAFWSQRLDALETEIARGRHAPPAPASHAQRKESA